MYETIKVDIKDQVGVLTFNRPDKMNAVSAKLIDEALDAVQKFNNDDNIRVFIITGEGKAFCAGADLSEIADKETSMDALKLLKNAHRLQLAIEESPKATICCYNGLAMGGGLELSLACDLRIASSKAKFALPEINAGLLPGSGGMSRLSQIIGVGRVKELVYTGRTFSPEEALSFGLVNRIVDGEELLEKGLELAQEIASKPPLGIQLAKETINANKSVDYRTGLNNESKVFGILFTTKDRKEGVQAFLEKRKPIFKGE